MKNDFSRLLAYITVLMSCYVMSLFFEYANFSNTISFSHPKLFIFSVYVCLYKHSKTTFH